MMLRVLLLFSVVVVFRAIYYFYYLNRAKSYKSILENYLNKQDNSSYLKLMEVQPQIKQLTKITGLDKVTIAVAQPLGLMMVSTASINTVDNIGNLREDVATTNHGILERAIGVCKSRLRSCFNPIFWIESVVYFPTRAFSYLGVTSDKSFVKLLQLLWWLITAAAMIVGVVFNKEFVNWLQRF